MIDDSASEASSPCTSAEETPCCPALHVHISLYKPSPVLNVCLPDEDSTNLKYRVSSWHSTHVSVRHKVAQYYLFTLVLLESAPAVSAGGQTDPTHLWQLVGTLGNWPLAKSAMAPWLARLW